MGGRPVSELNWETGSIEVIPTRAPVARFIPCALPGRRSAKSGALPRRFPSRADCAAPRGGGRVLFASPVGRRSALMLSPEARRSCGVFVELPRRRSPGAAIGAVRRGRTAPMRYPSPDRRVMMRDRAAFSRRSFGACRARGAGKGGWQGHVGIGRIHDLGGIGLRRRRGGNMLAILVFPIGPDPRSARGRLFGLSGRTRRPALAQPAFCGRP